MKLMKTWPAILSLLLCFLILRFTIYSSYELSDYDLYVAVPILVGFICGAFFLNRNN